MKFPHEKRLLVRCIWAFWSGRDNRRYEEVHCIER